MTTDEWTYRPETEVDDRTDRPEPSTDVREPFADVDLSEPDDQPPARTNANDAPADQTEEKAGFPSRATTMAIMSHMSVLFGIPVFLVSLVRRKHALSLHHAKAAAVIWFFFYAFLGLSSLSSALFLPLAFLFYLPALAGIYRAVQGREAGKWGLGDLGERVFPYPRVGPR